MHKLTLLNKKFATKAEALDANFGRDVYVHTFTPNYSHRFSLYGPKALNEGPKKVEYRLMACYTLEGVYWQFKPEAFF